MEFIYTPQQLAGYKGYNQRVRIGNWTEDQVQIDSRIADYIHKKKERRSEVHSGGGTIHESVCRPGA